MKYGFVRLIGKTKNCVLEKEFKRVIKVSLSMLVHACGSTIREVDIGKSRFKALIDCFVGSRSILPSRNQETNNSKDKPIQKNIK